MTRRANAFLQHCELSDREARSLIRQKKICYAGNRKLKIYGKLSCSSGKRMKRENRVLFASEKEAIAAGYRPCAHCCRQHYTNWKQCFL